MTARNGVLRFLLCVSIEILLIDGLAVIPRPKNVGVGGLVQPHSEAEEGSVPPGGQILLRIRATRESDIGDIATLLAAASVGADSDVLSWKQRIGMLRTREGMHSLLQQRFHTLRVGREATAKVSKMEDHVRSDSDRLRLLWEHSNFASRLEQAATMSSEPHVWKDHNFALCPQSACQMQHVMMTAEDVRTKTIVGFCEVAMMSAPRQHEAEGVSYAPTIANLVTSTKHRRQGIGSSIVQSAARFVKIRWKSDDVALYVLKNNDRAVSLYNKLGFHSVCSGGERDEKWYMTRRSTARRKGTEAAIKDRELVLR